MDCIWITYTHVDKLVKDLVVLVWIEYVLGHFHTVIGFDGISISYYNTDYETDYMIITVFMFFIVS